MLKNNPKTRDDFLQHFKQTNAFLEGHFIYSSGVHSPIYLQCALALQKPKDAEEFGKVIADNYLSENFDIVVSPAFGGIIIGYEVAKRLNVPFFWTERYKGEMMLRRGFSIKPSEKILVVEDVITTGLSTRECIEVLEKLGGKVTAVASIIDHSGGKADVGVPRISLLTFDTKYYSADSCPNCKNGEIAIKPGSRSS